MNIAEILKDCPKGTELYSTILGPVKLKELRNDDPEYPIVVGRNNSRIISLTEEGKYYRNYDGECILFPSKENRDWSTFRAPKKRI